MVGFYPETVKEALQILQEANTTIFNGGTDLMVRRNIDEKVIFINKIDELQEITSNEEYYILGAGATFTELINSDIPDIMKEVFSNIASPAIRNRGTIGGNICNASPAGDSLPMLYVLDAMVVLAKLAGDTIEERLLPISDFIKGVRKTELADNEILTKILIPVKYFNGEHFFYYKKVGARRAEAISKLSFFGRARVSDGLVKRIRFAFGAMGPTVILDDNIKALVYNASKLVFVNKISKIMDISLGQLTPIDDQRSSVEYRKRVAGNLLMDYLKQISNRL